MATPVYEYDTPFKSEFFKDVPTCALVEELQKRTGVETIAAGPYEPFAVSDIGPAIILVVTD